MTGERGERGERRPPDRFRGTPRPLSDRAARWVSEAATVDRRARYAQRLREVEEHQRSARRVRVVTLALGWLAGAAVATVGGFLLGGTLGVLVGVVALGLVAAGHAAVGALARRRGAPAWDWRAQRYRLLGRPADEVQARDRPPSRPR